MGAALSRTIMRVIIMARSIITLTIPYFFFMITDEFVVEKPSFVEIKLTGDNIILYDYLLEQRFVLSPIAYEMFLEFDGIKSIRDIAIIIAQEYGEVLENIIHDVTDLVVSLARGKCMYL